LYLKKTGVFLEREVFLRSVPLFYIWLVIWIGVVAEILIND